MKPQAIIQIPVLIPNPQRQALAVMSSPDHEEAGVLPIPTRLMGAALVSAGADAARYLDALNSGDMDRLRRMLQTSMDIGGSWAVRLNSK